LDNQLIEIKDYSGAGYLPLVSFGTWRVAALRFLDELKPENLKTMERHHETDEVFVLVKGVGMLLLGGNLEKPGNIQSVVMKIGEIYNVRKNTWHSISITEDAHVIIVENDDTNAKNSEILTLEDNDRLYTRNIVTEFLNHVN